VDADAAGGLTPALHERMSSLIRYAVAGGADAVQLSCSMYGPVAYAADQVEAATVLASDQAMFERVVEVAPARVGILGSLASAVADSAARLAAHLADAGVASTIATRVVDGASEAANAGDPERLERLMVEAALELGRQVDLLVLAQYSLAPTRAGIAAVSAVPVLSAPQLAASRLAELLTRSTP